MPQHKVKFTVDFEATIEVPEGTSVFDAACDIDIPEHPDCRYVKDSFEILIVDGEDVSL